MKKLIIFLLLPLFVYAQDEKRETPGVELPEFVITGQNVISLQQTRKPAAEMIPVTSGDFFRPPISPETPEIMELTGPDLSGLTLRDSVNVQTGRIKTMLGVYTLPMADVFLSTPFSSGILNGHLTGENIRPYVDDAERYFLNAGLGYSVFSGYQSSFLPGTEYNFKGDFNSKSYKLFAGQIPVLKRNLYQGSLGASIKNIYNPRFMAGFSADYQSTSIGNEKYSENLLSLAGFGKSNLGSASFGAQFRYSNFSFKDSSGSMDAPDYFMIKPFAGLEVSRVFKVSVGINYSKSGSSYFTGLFANAGFRINESLSVYGEYSPSGEFISSSGLLEKNIYFNPQNTPAVFYKKSQDLSGMVRYEYATYFEINGGLRYRAYKDLPYFSIMNQDGTFGLEKTNSDSYSWFANLLFNKGPFGYFYGSVEGGSVKNKENQVVPYFPSFLTSLTYGYDFPIGLSAEAVLDYRSGIYSDIENTDKLDDYVNLSINASYKIVEDFRLIGAVNNILNSKNYLWKNYREIPADFMAGLSYSW